MENNESLKRRSSVRSAAWSIAQLERIHARSLRSIAFLLRKLASSCANYGDRCVAPVFLQANQSAFTLGAFLRPLRNYSAFSRWIKVTWTKIIIEERLGTRGSCNGQSRMRFTFIRMDTSFFFNLELNLVFQCLIDLSFYSWTLERMKFFEGL